MIRIKRQNIDTICEWWTKAVCGLNRRSSNKFFKYWNENKKEIVSCKADMLGTWIDMFNRHDFRYRSNSAKQNAWKEFCSYMTGQYNRARKMFVSELLDKLDVKVCPYCNRQFTNKVEGTVIHAELDHFYPKSKFPYLALSFYNLIPVCSVCNLVKDEQQIGINPYVDDFHSHQVDFNIDSMVSCLYDENNWSVALPSSNDDCNKNIETFKLNELYSQHKDIARDIAIRSVAYSSDYADNLKSLLGIDNLSETDMKRIILGNYTDDEDLEKRPLAKFTADIYHQINEKEK